MSYHREEKDGQVPTRDSTKENWDTWVIKVGVQLKNRTKMETKPGHGKIDQPPDLTTTELHLAPLKKNLLASAVPELGRHFRKWRAFRRFKSESMKLYVMRCRKTVVNMIDSGAEIKLQLADLVT